MIKRQQPGCSLSILRYLQDLLTLTNKGNYRLPTLQLSPLIICKHFCELNIGHTREINPANLCFVKTLLEQSNCMSQLFQVCPVILSAFSETVELCDMALSVRYHIEIDFCHDSLWRRYLCVIHTIFFVACVEFTKWVKLFHFFTPCSVRASPNKVIHDNDSQPIIVLCWRITVIKFLEIPLPSHYTSLCSQMWKGASYLHYLVGWS